MQQRKAPMTADEARENVAAMERETPKPAQRRLLQAALGGFGNLTEEAREVYKQRLAQI